MAITIPNEMTGEFNDFVNHMSADFNTEYYVYCHFCGEHNAPYRTDLKHKPDCLGEKLIMLALNEED